MDDEYIPSPQDLWESQQADLHADESYRRHLEQEAQRLAEGRDPDPIHPDCPF